MTAKIFSFKQLFEVVWQPHDIKFNHVARKLLDLARMDITVYVSLLVQKIYGSDYLLEYVKQF